MIILIYGNLVKNVKRTLLTVFCLSVTVMVTGLLLSFYYSFISCRQNKSHALNGGFHVGILKVSEGEKSGIEEEMKKLNACVGTTSVYLYEKCKYESGEEDYIYIVSNDEAISGMNLFYAEAGRLPDKAGEIALPYTSEFVVGKAVGDEITLNNESYTITGFFNDDNCGVSRADGIIAIVNDILNVKPVYYNLYISFSSETEYERGIASICKILGINGGQIHDYLKENFSYRKNTVFNNSYVIGMDFGDYAFRGEREKIIKSTVCFLGILMLTICFFMNLNVLSSYFDYEKNQMRILRSVGYTDFQVKLCKLIQIVLLQVLAIISGIIFTGAVSFVMVSILQNIRFEKLSYLRLFFDKAIFINTLKLCAIMYCCILVLFLLKEFLCQTDLKYHMRCGKIKHILLDKIIICDERLHMFEKLTKGMVIFISGMTFMVLFFAQRYLKYKMRIYDNGMSLQAKIDVNKTASLLLMLAICSIIFCVIISLICIEKQKCFRYEKYFKILRSIGMKDFSMIAAMLRCIMLKSLKTTFCVFIFVNAYCQMSLDSMSIHVLFTGLTGCLIGTVICTFAIQLFSVFVGYRSLIRRDM